MSQVDEITLDDVYEEVAEEPEVITEEPETVEAAEEDAEEPVKTETAEPEESTTDSKKPEEWTLTAVMDEREKRQKAVQEAEELRQKLAQYEKPEDGPSIFEDEKAYTENQDKKLKDEVNNVALNMSQAFANQTFGKDKVDAAAEWFKTEGIKSPHLIDRYSKAELPFHEVVSMFEEEQARLDPDAYKAQLKAELLEELKAEAPKEDDEPITPSLASKKSSGKASTNASESFEDILGD